MKYSDYVKDRVLALSEFQKAQAEGRAKDAARLAIDIIAAYRDGDDLSQSARWRIDVCPARISQWRWIGFGSKWDYNTAYLHLGKWTVRIRRNGG